VSQRASGTFTGLVDGAFGLLRSTWSTALLWGGTAFLPAAALYGWAYGRLFAALAGAWAEAGAAAASLPAIAGAFLPVLAAALAQGFARLCVRSCVTERAAIALRGGRVPAPAIAGRVLRRAGARLVGQRVLQALIVAGIATGVVIVAAIVAAAAAAIGGRAGVGSAEATGITLLAILLGYLAFLVLGIWLWVRFSLTLESVVLDDARASRSFGLSASLVRGSWWRVFGWRLLFALMLGFAVSLFATPIVFFATIRAYARYLAEMVRGTADASSLADMVRAMGSGLPVRLAVTMYLQSLLGALFAPAFMTLLYVEMKRRASEGA